jgi:hypothetical protein
MKAGERREIRCRQDVGVENPKRGFRFNPSPIGKHGSRTAQQGGFLKEPHLYVRSSCREKLSNGVSVGMEIYQYLVDSMLLANFKPDREKWSAPNWHKALRHVIGKRT